MDELILNKIINILNKEEYVDEKHKRLKRVVLISPDFFPRKVSEISINLKEIGEKLVDYNIDTYIIAYDPMKHEAKEEINGIKVHYVSTPIDAYSPLTWASVFSVDISRKVADIYHDVGDIDLIHSHDWSTFPAGINLKKVLNKPLIVNFYSTEEQRSNWVDNLYTRSVKLLEMNTIKNSEKIHTTKVDTYNILQQKIDEFNKLTYINPYERGWQNIVIKDYRMTFVNYNKEEVFG